MTQIGEAGEIFHTILKPATKLLSLVFWKLITGFGKLKLTAILIRMWNGISE